MNINIYINIHTSKEMYMIHLNVHTCMYIYVGVHIYRSLCMLQR